MAFVHTTQLFFLYMIHTLQNLPALVLVAGKVIGAPSWNIEPLVSQTWLSFIGAKLDASLARSESAMITSKAAAADYLGFSVSVATPA